MKCIICHSTDIRMQHVHEQLSRGQDVILIPLEVLVCSNCGERYYDRRTMQRLERTEEALKAGRLALKRVGEVLQVAYQAADA